MLGGRYVLERLLGEGGMGAVWAARHLITKKQVALKLLKNTAASNEKALKRFLREARAVSAVRHPNVVQVHDVIQLEDGSPIMVMDLLDGEDLGAKLGREGRLELSELTRLLLPVISAVGTAHAAGIVHRDLKPDNIMLHRQPDGSIVPKVLDFGIAKLSAREGEAAATADLTQTGAVMGTAYYMPPEQLFGEKDIDQRADVWAMGIIIYECISGKKPIEGDNFGQIFKSIAMGSIQPLPEVAPWVPADVCELVARMLVTDRHARCPDLRDAYNVLSGHTEASARSFGPPVPEEPALRSDVAAQSVDGVTRDTAAGSAAAASRSKLWMAVALASLAGAGGAGGAAWFFTRASPTETSASSAAEPLGPPVTASAPGAPIQPLITPVESRGSLHSASAVVSASPPGPSARPPVARRKPGPTAATQPSATQPPATPTAPAATSTRISGGVVGEAPF